jgi:lipopolysaccharide/colanic/teichoic acid biosynthesis glycosyltransferase
LTIDCHQARPSACCLPEFHSRRLISSPDGTGYARKQCCLAALRYRFFLFPYVDSSFVPEIPPSLVPPMFAHTDNLAPSRSADDTAVNVPALTKKHEVISPERTAPARPEVLVFPKRPIYAAVKRVAECLFAAVLLVVVTPVLLIIAALVKLTSRGPVFYSQVRLGEGGRPFVLHKVRSMAHDCEKKSGPRWSMPGDPRITRLGRFLRRTHLDELPQLWNVIRGDMSLVGPRPERPEFVPGLEKAIPHYRDRLHVRPGVTGLAQVQLAADTDLESVRHKLAYDLYYLQHGNIWMDLRIVACTAVHMLGVPYAVLGRLFCFPSLAHVQKDLHDRINGSRGCRSVRRPSMTLTAS